MNYAGTKKQVEIKLTILLEFIINILKDCLNSFQQPLPHILWLTFNNQQSLSESIISMMTSSSCKNELKQNRLLYTPFQQFVLDNIFTISCQQMMTMHYFIQIVLNELKQDQTQANCSPLLQDFFSKGVFQTWATFLIQINDLHLAREHQGTFDHISQIIKKKNDLSDPILSLLNVNHLGFGRDYIVDSQEIFNCLYNNQSHPVMISNYVALVQRYNLLEGFKQATQKAFYSLSALAQVVQSSGTNGIPLSCHSMNSNLFIQCYNQDYLIFISSKVCKIFKHNDEEINKLTTDLAKEMIIPNNGKILINGGLISLFSGDKNQNEPVQIEKSFQNLIYLLEQCTKEVCYVLETSSETEWSEQIDQLIPALQINQSIIQSLILLLDFNRTTPSNMTSTTSISHFNNSLNNNLLLINSEEINMIADHQIEFFIVLTSIKPYINDQFQSQYIFLILELLNSLMTFIDKSSQKINEPIQNFIEQQMDNRGNMLTILQNVAQLISVSQNDNQIFLLASILMSAVKIYPASVSEIVISDAFNSQVDITRMFINTLKKPQTHFVIFASIVCAWNSMINVLGREFTDYLLIKRQIMQLLINQPDLMAIANEVIYVQCKTEIQTYEHNYMHIMWCYTLSLVRDAAAHSGVESLKYIINFFDAFKPRIFSALLYFDNSVSLQHFTKVLQINLSELQRQNFQPGILGLIELQLITILMNQIIFTQNFKNNYPLVVDQVIYVFSNILFAQLSTFKRIKSVLNQIKPFTFLEEKFNQLRADIPANEVILLSTAGSMTPRKQAQTDPTIYSENKTDLYFYSKPQVNLKQRMEIEVSDFTAFQLVAVLDYLNLCQVSIIGLVQTLEFRDLADRFEVRIEGRKPLGLEKNYWFDLSEQIVRYVYCNIDIYINLKHYSNLENLLQFVNLAMASFDYSVQNGGIQQLFGYPQTRSEVRYVCLHNIINGIYGGLLHLQLRDMFRQAQLMRENTEMEINLSRKMIQLIDIMEQETQAPQPGGVQDINEDILNEIYSHDIHETTNNYWHDWKDRFEAYLK